MTSVIWLWPRARPKAVCSAADPGNRRGLGTKIRSMIRIMSKKYYRRRLPCGWPRVREGRARHVGHQGPRLHDLPDRHPHSSSTTPNGTQRKLEIRQEAPSSGSRSPIRRSIRSGRARYEGSGGRRAPPLQQVERPAKGEVAKIAGTWGPSATLEPMRPWMAAFLLAEMQFLKAGYDPKAGVERVLKAQAGAEGDKIHASRPRKNNSDAGGHAEADQVAFLVTMLDDLRRG